MMLAVPATARDHLSFNYVPTTIPPEAQKELIAWVLITGMGICKFQAMIKTLNG